VNSGATSLAEGKYIYKTDVNLVLGNERAVRAYVLRATLETLPEWKNHNVGVGLAPYDECRTVMKKAAVIDNEMWVYHINATLVQDIVGAVKIASHYFKVDPAVFLHDIYIKNLNDDRQSDLLKESKEALIRANKDLYSGTCNALTEAAKLLGVSGRMNLYVFSHNKNPKIPQKELHDALESGGADSVETDTNRPYAESGANKGDAWIGIDTNFHLATFKL